MNSLKALTKKIRAEKEVVAANGVATNLTQPSENKLTHKFSEEQKLNIIRLIAEGLTSSQVISEANKKFGMTLTHMAVHDYRITKKWQPIIKELQARHAEMADTLDASKKHVRVRRMEVVFDDAIANGKTRDALQAHSLIQKEYESTGDTVNLLLQNNSLYQQFNALSPDELLCRQREATLKLKEKQNGSSGQTVEDSKQ